MGYGLGREAFKKDKQKRYNFLTSGRGALMGETGKVTGTRTLVDREQGNSSSFPMDSFILTPGSGGQCYSWLDQRSGSPNRARDTKAVDVTTVRETLNIGLGGVILLFSQCQWSLKQIQSKRGFCLKFGCFSSFR